MTEGQGPGGVGLEVKQSAARQNWYSPDAKPCPARFDIAERTGRWTAKNKWVAAPGRAAAIYLFAHHPVTDGTADHRDPMQWDFYVASASRLPAQKTIGLSAVRRPAKRTGYDELLPSVTSALESLPTRVPARLEPSYNNR